MVQVFTTLGVFDYPTMNESVLFMHSWVYIKHLMESKHLFNYLHREYPSSLFFRVKDIQNIFTICMGETLYLATIRLHMYLTLEAYYIGSCVFKG